jgi:hypothetical protein
VEIFAKDLWEALRQDLREQVGFLAEFDILVPTWEGLSSQARHEKIQSVRSDLLKPIIRAGYEIRRQV